MGREFEGSYVRASAAARPDPGRPDGPVLRLRSNAPATRPWRSIPCWSRPASKPATPSPSRAFGGAIWIRRPPGGLSAASAELRAQLRLRALRRQHRPTDRRVHAIGLHGCDGRGWCRPLDVTRSRSTVGLRAGQAQGCCAPAQVASDSWRPARPSGPSDGGRHHGPDHQEEIGGPEPDGAVTASRSVCDPPTARAARWGPAHGVDGRALGVTSGQAKRPAMPLPDQRRRVGHGAHDAYCRGNGWQW